MNDACHTPVQLKEAGYCLSTVQSSFTACYSFVDVSFHSVTFML